MRKTPEGGMWEKAGLSLFAFAFGRKAERKAKGRQPQPPLLRFLAPQVGLEPTTLRLTAECSAIELLRNICSRQRIFSPLKRTGFIANGLRSVNRRRLEVSGGVLSSTASPGYGFYQGFCLLLLKQTRLFSDVMRNVSSSAARPVPVKTSMC